MIYFIQDPYRNAIKIGHGINPQKRLESCQVGNPYHLIMLGMIPGGRSEERKLHEKFKDFRLRGEWFRSDPLLMEELRRLPLKSMSFKGWLFRQIGREDPIGDLADDVDRDCRIGKWSWNGELKSLLKHIRLRTSFRDPRMAAVEAWREYQSLSQDSSP